MVYDVLLGVGIAVSVPIALGCVMLLIIKLSSYLEGTSSKKKHKKKNRGKKR